MRRLLAVLVTVLGAAALLTGCGADVSTPSQATTSSGPVLLDITIDDGTVTPTAERVDVPVGSLVSMSIHSDEDGRIHVHSSPQQSIEYHPGTTRAYLGRFSVPERVTIDSPRMGKTVAVLVVQ